MAKIARSADKSRPEFAVRLHTLRHLAGWTQAELAVAAAEKPDQLARWERGNIEPRLTALLHLSDALGVDLDVLACRAPVPPDRAQTLSEDGLAVTSQPPPAKVCADSRRITGDAGMPPLHRDDLDPLWRLGGRCRGCTQGPVCRFAAVADRILAASEAE